MRNIRRLVKKNLKFTRKTLVANKQKTNSGHGRADMLIIMMTIGLALLVSTHLNGGSYLTNKILEISFVDLFAATFFAILVAELLVLAVGTFIFRRTDVSRDDKEQFERERDYLQRTHGMCVVAYHQGRRIAVSTSRKQLNNRLNPELLAEKAYYVRYVPTKADFSMTDQCV